MLRKLEVIELPMSEQERALSIIIKNIKFKTQKVAYAPAENHDPLRS